MTTVATSAVRRFDHGAFDAAELAELRGDTTITVCLPARNEAETVGDIVSAIHRELVERVALVQDLLVLDDDSTDATARVAAAAGARVISANDVLTDHPPGPGKGQALWRSLHASTSDIIVWCDADIAAFDTGFVLGLLGPLLHHPELVFVKGCYERPNEAGEGGGRVTELLARPAIALLHPQLAVFEQPLAGEFAGRRAALEHVPFLNGYGVDLGLLIDLVARFGADRVGQVGLGMRRHRNRPLSELGPQAVEVLHVALSRAGLRDLPNVATLAAPGSMPEEIALVELPPLASLTALSTTT